MDEYKLVEYTPEVARALQNALKLSPPSVNHNPAPSHTKQALLPPMMANGAVVTSSGGYSGYWQLSAYTSTVIGDSGAETHYFVSTANPPNVHAYGKQYQSAGSGKFTEIPSSGLAYIYAQFGYLNEDDPIHFVANSSYFNGDNIIHPYTLLGSVANGYLYQSFQSYESEQYWHSYTGKALVEPYSNTESGAVLLLSSQATDLGDAPSAYIAEDGAMRQWVYISGAYVDSGYSVSWLVTSEALNSSSLPVIPLGRVGITLTRPDTVEFKTRWVVIDE